MKLIVAFRNYISGAPKMDLEKFVVLLGNGYTHCNFCNCGIFYSSLKFVRLSTPALGPIKPPVHWVQGFLPGGKAAGSWR